MRAAVVVLLLALTACSSSSEPTVITGADLVQIVAGGDNTCGRDAEGRVFCWGRDADTMAVTVPSQVVLGPLRFTDVAVGRDYACALSAAGDPICWEGVTGGPFALSGAPALDHMVIGHFPCGVTDDGAIWCWNTDEEGATEVAAAGVLTGLGVDQFACGLTAEGKARCWGGAFPTVPTPVHDSVTWDHLVPMNGWACGVPVGKSARCFLVSGGGTPGALTTVDTTVIADGTKFVKVAGENVRAGFITDGGRAYHKTINQVFATPEGSTVDWNWIIAGQNHLCGEVVDGTLRCWWDNTIGQLGDGTTTFRVNAVLIGGGAP